MVSLDGGSAGKVDDVTACRIQDGGYALLWQRYDNKMAAICYYGNVMARTRWRLCVTMETLSQHSDNVFYIFNSTVVDWTCYIIFFLEQCGEWSVVKWSDVMWSEVNWSELKCSEKKWCVKWSEGKGSELKWCHVKWRGVKWCHVKYTEVKWRVKWNEGKGCEVVMWSEVMYVKRSERKWCHVKWSDVTWYEV